MDGDKAIAAENDLTYWGLNKMINILQTAYSNAFS